MNRIILAVSTVAVLLAVAALVLWSTQPRVGASDASLHRAPRLGPIAEGASDAPLLSTPRLGPDAGSTSPTQPSFDSPSFAGEVPKKYVFNVVLHKAEEIDQLLTRAEKLAGQRPVSANAGIALVLHGPEVEFFRQNSYARYKPIVDRARRLNQAGVIEIKICRTQMKAHGIEAGEIHDFIEVVPFGPAEIERLKGLGYVSL